MATPRSVVRTLAACAWLCALAGAAEASPQQRVAEVPTSLASAPLSPAARAGQTLAIVLLRPAASPRQSAAVREAIVETVDARPSAAVSALDPAIQGLLADGSTRDELLASLHESLSSAGSLGGDAAATKAALDRLFGERASSSGIIEPVGKKSGRRSAAIPEAALRPAAKGEAKRLALSVPAAKPPEDGLLRDLAFGVREAFLAPPRLLLVAAALPWVYSRDPKTRGAGSDALGSFGLGYGTVKPVDTLTAGSLAVSAPSLAAVEAARAPGTRVLTDAEIALLSAGRKRPSNTITEKPGKAADAAFDAAADQVNRWAAAGEDLDREKLLLLHKLLFRGTSSAWTSGKFRRFLPVSDISTYHYAIPFHVSRHVDDFFFWYEANKNSMPPAQLAAMAYQQLVRIHPFTDGNGRVSRLAMDLILQLHGLPPAIFPRGMPEAVRVSTPAVVEAVARGVLESQALLKEARAYSLSSPSK